MKDHNLVRLLKIFRKHASEWVDWASLLYKYPNEKILLDDIDRLLKHGFLDTERYARAFDTKDNKFQISVKGLAFLSSIDSHKLSRDITLMTAILMIIAIGTIFFTFAQAIISLWF